VSVTASTTLETFFAALSARIVAQLPATLAGTRAFVVDKLRFQSTAAPNIQIEPISLQTIGDQSSVNAMTLEYRIHAVVKVEFDIGKRETKRLLGDAPTAGTMPRGAFPLVVAIASGVSGWAMTNASSSAQVLLRVEAGSHDELEGLATANAQFRTLLRVMNDG
jgi:hypothetical protein